MSNTFKALITIASIFVFSGCKTLDGVTQDFNSMFSSNETSNIEIAANEGLEAFTVHAEEGLKNKNKLYTSENIAYNICQLAKYRTMSVEYLKDLKDKNQEQFTKCKQELDIYMTGAFDKDFRSGGVYYKVGQRYLDAQQFIEF